MKSTGRQAGLEISIRRKDGSRFTESDVKHSFDESGRAIAECRLESEDDAVFEIVLELDRSLLKRFKESQWSMDAFVDGRPLVGGSWVSPQDPFVWDRTIEKVGEDFKVGMLTFGVAETTTQADKVTVSHGMMQALETIRVEITPGKLHPTKRVGSTPFTTPIGVVREDLARPMRIVKSTSEEVFKQPEVEVEQFYFRSGNPQGVWQIFKFDISCKQPISEPAIGKDQYQSPNTAQGLSITPTASPSSGPTAQQFEPPNDSHSNADSCRSSTAINKDIEYHRSAIRDLKRELKGKGKAKKRTRSEDACKGLGGGVVAKKAVGRSIDPTDDSD